MKHTTSSPADDQPRRGLGVHFRDLHGSGNTLAVGESVTIHQGPQTISQRMVAYREQREAEARVHRQDEISKVKRSLLFPGIPLGLIALTLLVCPQVFLRGPVPWSWLNRAAALEHAALAVALALRFRQGLQHGAGAISVNLAQLAMGDAHLNTVRRGLHALEAAGLVTVERPPGRNLAVTFRDLPGPEPSNPETIP